MAGSGSHLRVEILPRAIGGTAEKAPKWAVVLEDLRFIPSLDCFPLKAVFLAFPHLAAGGR